MKLISLKLKILLYVIVSILLCRYFVCNTYADTYSNNGIELTIYDNENQYTKDDMNIAMGVTMKIKNKNMYADADVDIVANDNITFRIVGNKKQSINIAPLDEVEMRFFYLYKGFHILDLNNKKKEIHVKADTGEEKIYDYEIYLKSLMAKTGGLVATQSVANELMGMLEDAKDEPAKKKNMKFPVWLVIVIVLIVAIVLVIILLKIYKEYKSTYFSIFIVIICSASLIMSNCRSIMAYGVETFLYGKRYTYTYQGRVHFANLIHNMSYTISYKYNGTNPYENSNEDSDGDMIINCKEVYYMSDINSIDTDGDGLSDYIEAYKLNLSPINVDTNYNGKNDSEEDYDGDGLTNIEEVNGVVVDGIRYFSSPTNVDTDFDGLNDYDEVKGNNIYNFTSDPSSIDTDNDTMSDYEELRVDKKYNLEKENIDSSKIALNPKNEKSNGITLDKERKFDQTLSKSLFESSLYKDNVVIPRISGKLNGNIDENISVKEDRNIVNDETILGKIINISNDYNEDIIVSFDVKNYSNKIEYLKIARFNNGKVELLDTEIFESEIKSHVRGGSVFVVDTTKLVDKIVSFRKDNWK